MFKNYFRNWKPLLITALAVLFVSCSDSYSSSGSGGNNGDLSNPVITFVDESGNTLGTQTVNNSIILDASDFKYKPAGYTCTYFDADGNQVYSGKFTTTKDCKITVKKTPISYTVKFAKSSNLYGTISGTLPESMTCTYDTEYTMPENNLTYVFGSTTYKSVGWTATDSSTAVKERGEYSGGSTFKNLSVKDGATVTLYACFTDDDGYTLKFYTSGTNGSYTTVYADAGIIPSNSIPAASSRTGYSFDGWYLSTDSTQTVIDFTTYKVTGNATFYAKFTALTYTITFVTDHGTAPEAITYQYSLTSGYLYLTNKDYVLADETGYTFNGWCIGDSSYTSSYFNYSTAADTTLTAKWTPWTATVKFNENSTTEHPISGGYSMNDQTLTWGEETQLYKVKFYDTNGKWAFAGWNQKEDGSGTTTWADGEKIKWSGSSNSETITLYAQWKEVQTPVTVKLSSPVEHSDISLTYDSTSYAFEAFLSGASSFMWYVDGAKVSGQTSSSFSVYKVGTGTHSLMVTAELGGNLYSATVAVTVTEKSE